MLSGVKDSAHARPARSPVVIGVAGGVGSGKSTVARELGALGAVVLNSDAAAKAALARPDVRAEIVGWWGKDVLNDRGDVDPRAVAKIVFADEAVRKRLEALLHPLVIREHERSIAAAAAAGVPAVVIDAPLLFEAGLDDRCDAVIFVEAPLEARLRRVAENRGWEAAELHRREKSQAPLEMKRGRAQYVVQNDAGLPELVGRVRQAFKAIMTRHGPRHGQGSVA